MTSHNRRGSALVAGLALLTFMGVLVLGYFSTALQSAHWTRSVRAEDKLNNACASLVALAIDDVWGAFERDHPAGGTRLEVRAYFDSLGLPNAAGNADAVPTDWRARLPISAGDEFAGVLVDRVSVLREDIGPRTRLTLDVGVHTGSLPDRRGGTRRAVREVFDIEPPLWQGLDFALLANNINCVMCHAEVDNAFRFYNDDPLKFGSFDRVKLGSLESLQLRDNPASWVAGTLYVAGHGLTERNEPIENWAETNLESRAFSASGLLLQDDWGDTYDAALEPADSDAPAPFQNLYLSYAAESGDQVDGFLPDSFPSPIPDNGGIDPDTLLPTSEGESNRLVDASEFLAASNYASGRLSGGSIATLAPDQRIATPAELNELAAGGLEALETVTYGNVFLVGTEDDPIVLNGEIAIDGDVVLQGYVKGTGSLLVSGNVYIPSDLKYLDGATSEGARTFGTAPDGSKNLLGIAAGGNVMVGNIFHPRWGRGETTGDTDGSFNFILDELALFNRMEWIKSQPQLPSEAGTLITNPNYAGAAYLPRYYGFTEGSTIPIFNKQGHLDAETGLWVSAEHAGSWAGSKLSYADPENPSDPFLFDDQGRRKAVVYTLTTDWMTDELLETMLSTTLAQRDNSTPMEVDGIFYSNNSIFGIIPTRSSPGTSGELIVNGAIIAADVGLLAPRRFQLNFDPRGPEVLNLRADTELGIRRVASVPIGVQ